MGWWASEQNVGWVMGDWMDSIGYPWDCYDYYITCDARNPYVSISNNSFVVQYSKVSPLLWRWQGGRPQHDQLQVVLICKSLWLEIEQFLNGVLSSRNLRLVFSDEWTTGTTSCQHWAMKCPPTIRDLITNQTKLFGILISSMKLHLSSKFSSCIHSEDLSF